MVKRSVLVCFALASSLLMLTSCANRGPTLADEMRGAAAPVQAEADRRAAMADNWERGQTLMVSGQRKVERAERNIRSAERNLESARRELEEGQNEVAEGRRLVVESESSFEQLRQQEVQGSGQR